MGRRNLERNKVSLLKKNRGIHKFKKGTPNLYLFPEKRKINMASGKKWRESDTLKFVKLYEETECLWNFRHPAYKNRNARDKACQYIVEAMNLPDFGINELKNKIKNIRSTYQQEVNKIRRSRTSGIGPDNMIIEEYKTNLAWFPIADRFLGTVINGTKGHVLNSFDHMPEDDTSSAFPTSDSDFYNLVETEINGSKDLGEKITTEYFSPVTVDQCQIKEEPSSLDDYNISFVPNPSNKRRRTSQQQVYEAIGSRPEENSDIHTIDHKFADEFYYFGSNVACQLRKLPLDRALSCQQQILELLATERIEVLKENGNQLDLN